MKADLSKLLFLLFLWREGKACQEGYYTNADSVCEPCPAGSSCDGSTATACTLPQWAAEIGQASCHDCPPGHICTSTTALPVACDAGEYPNGAKNACSTCAAGSFCADPTASELTCAANDPDSFDSYSAAGATECTVCPAGKDCTATAEGSACSSGEYSTLGDNACTACVAGEFCPSTSVAAQNCPTGSFTDSGSETACTDCTAGSSCTSSAATACGTQEVSPTGVAACATCPTDYICDDDTQASATLCKDGEHINSNTCTACADGSYCDGSTETACPTTMMSTGKGYCVGCTPGETCDGTSTSSGACAAGNYIDQAGACQPCPSGQVCPDASGGPQYCPFGYCPRGDQTVCEVAAEGKECDYHDTATTDCTNGFFSGEGAVQCETCPSGYDCSAFTLTALAPCGAGQTDDGSGACTACTGNTVCPQAVPGQTQACPDGTAQDSSTTCPITDFLAYTDDGINEQTCGGAEASGKGFGYCVACSDYELCDGVSDHQNVYCAPGTVPDGANGCEDDDAGVFAQHGQTVAACWGGTNCLGGCEKCTIHDDETIVWDKAEATVGCYNYNLVDAADKKEHWISYQRRRASNDNVFCQDVLFPSNTYNKFAYYFYDVADNYASNITCPYRSIKYDWWYNQTATYEETYVHYDMSITNYEDYPFCKIDSNGVYTEVEWDIKEGTCTLNTDYATAFGDCVPTFPGFYTEIGDATTTDAYYQTSTHTKIPANFYTRLTQEADYGTRNIMKRCPPGTEAKFAGGGSEEQVCQVIEDGDCFLTSSHYCNQGREYFCPLGMKKVGAPDGKSMFGTCEPCVAGEYCGEGVARADTCTAGTYCPYMTQDENELPAPPGHYIGGTTADAYGDETDCSDGSFCAPKATADTNCKAGTRSLIGANQHDEVMCEPCDEGTACTSAGMTTGATPTACTDGYYCPQYSSSATMLECEPGTKGNGGGAGGWSKCAACTAGQFCAGGTAAEVDCTEGFYCLSYTIHAQETKCAEGYYSNAAASSCTICPAGDYCPETGTSKIQCPANYYCPEGSTEPTPCPSGETSSAGSGADTECGVCTAGYMCPFGSDPIACPIGYYHDGTTTTTSDSCFNTPAGQYTSATTQTAGTNCADGKWSVEGHNSATCEDCPQGYFCAGGVKTQCSGGKWCPAGSSSEATCPAGQDCTAPGTGLVLPCPSGSVCTGGTLVDATAGKWTAQSESSSSSACGAGFICPDGAKGPNDEPCAVNSYSGVGATSCTQCSAGNHCPLGSGSETTCPQGFYCPEAKLYPVKCPKGTYGAATGLAAATDCTACTDGKYCSLPGLTAVEGDCDPGFVCKRDTINSDVGSWTPRPNGGEITEEQYIGYKCPAGGYCPAGSAEEQPCPVGTFNAFEGMSSAADCVACTPGYYCDGASATGTTGQCAGGYYCPGAAEDDKGKAGATTEYAAAVGYYAPVGSSQQILCAPGTFTDATAQSACSACTAGYFCDTTGVSAPTICPKGYYCVQGSIHAAPCPPGTYRATTGATLLSECADCPAGNSCPDYAMEAVTDTCEAGYYCQAGSETTTPAIDPVAPFDTFGLCPTGHYCEAAITTTPAQCAAGTYLPSLGASASTDCLKCDPGKYCATDGLETYTGDCPATKYCAGSTITPVDCPKGSFCVTGSEKATLCVGGTFQANTLQTSCDNCSPGNYCPEGADAEITCPVGHYCPANTARADQKKCPRGTYNFATGATDEASGCTDCPAGKFCRLEGAVEDDGLGHGDIQDGYIKTGPGNRTPIPQPDFGGKLCGPGNYCVAGVEIPCDAGSYCDSYQLTAVAGNCIARHYCQAGATSKAPQDLAAKNGDICPSGKYCGVGTSVPTDCPVGTQNQGTGLAADTECTTCPQGYFCATLGLTDYSANVCPAGYFCSAGTDNAVPTSVCPIGHYCEAAAKEAILCDGGFFQDSTTQTSCKSCTVNNYCPFDSATPTPLTAVVTCPVGHYCDKVEMNAAVPCPPGSYQDATGQSTCKNCPAGYYCPEEGMDDFSAHQCPAGYYCAENTADYGDYMCTPGHYCPLQSSVQTECDAGSYCVAYGLSAVSGTCTAGFICSGKAIRPDPRSPAADGGYVCPTGYFCEAGDTAEQPCPIGTYNEKEGAYAEATFCLDCPDGKRCETVGLTSPLETCEAGKFCTGGDQEDCHKGHKCPADVLPMMLCDAGTYQDTVGQATCKDCTAGNYCYYPDFAGGDFAIIAETTCPSGYYCPAKTGHPNTFPCPPGTFRAATGAASASDCNPCTEKYYCPDYGMTVATTYPCGDGFLCAQGSKTYKGSEKCPKNFYCVAGVDMECPDGTYTEVEGAIQVEECRPCSPGQVCPNHSTGVQACNLGYYCPAGLYVYDATATSYSGATGEPTKCPTGHYCGSTGLSQPIACEPGTYQDTEGQTSCLTCPAGEYCPSAGMTAGTACPGGYICPQGSINPELCPAGYMVDTVSACKVCEAGSYCKPAAAGNAAVTGACDNGYVCGGGAQIPMPHDEEEQGNVNARIAPGYYNDGSNLMAACAAGTWTDSYYSQTCKECYHGHYCPITGMSSINLYTCTAGYACTTDSLVVATGVADLTVNVCKRGYYCPAGTTRQLVCDDGHYTDSEGQSLCSSCPEGFYCYNGVIDSATPTAMAVADYPIACLTNQGTCTGANPVLPMCDDGKYLSVGEDECLTCTATNYCYANVIVGNCIAGYYCGTGMSHPAEQTECEENFYCVAGATDPVKCPTGTFSTNTGNIQEDDCTPCPPGFTCPRNADEPIECPEGYYCIIGSNEETPCPVGTYNPVRKLIVEAECLSCPAGYICKEEAMVTYKSSPCSPGHYCPHRASVEIACPAGTYRSSEGAKSIDNCNGCPTGYYCPLATVEPIRCSDGRYCPYGSIAPRLCPGGYYCNELNNYQLDDCPINHKCPRKSSQPIPCTGRHVCGENTEIEDLCPAGTYVQDNSIYYLQNQCIDCAPGTYSTLLDLGSCRVCPAGYICYGGTNRANPTSIFHHKGKICPKGHYCPEGTLYELPCTEGTYNDEEGATDINSCKLCPENTFNDQVGQEGCRPCGFYATSGAGAQTCSCQGAFRAFSETDSSCTCKSGYDFKNEEGVSQGSQSSMSNCIPKVYDRCQGTDITRAPDGSCKSIYDCEDECEGGSGIRSEKLGVCTCETTQPVDFTCPTQCRNRANRGGMTGDSTDLEVTNPSTGEKIKVDLSELGQVLGYNDCANTDGTACRTHFTEMGTSISGTYGPSNALSQQASRLLAQKGMEFPKPSFAQRLRGRTLQTEVNTAEIGNPVFCIAEEEVMLFTITDNTHYPVYMKDSVMNSNIDFDYGSFRELERSMKNKQEIGDDRTTFFRFTFDEEGTYVFQDASNSNKLMLVKVVGAGEKCYDSDRYIQPMSLDALASIGVEQNENIILRLDVPLLVGMTSAMVLSAAIVLVSVAYCLKKGWRIRRMRYKGYRLVNEGLKIDHSDPATHGKLNDFEKYKTDEQEALDNDDDFDKINLDIHTDLVDAGADYLKIFEDKRDSRLKDSENKKKKINRLLLELEHLMNTIGSNAVKGNMQFYDENAAKLQEGEDEEEAARRRAKEREEAEARKRREQELDRQRREAMMQNWSDRDKRKLREAKEGLNKRADLLKKELTEDPKAKKQEGDVTFAIYDEGNVKSRMNQVVARIENNEDLTDPEKEALLQGQERNLVEIDKLMEGERVTQDTELERALRERIERRKRMLEKKHKKDIAIDFQTQKQKIIDEVEQEKQVQLQQMENEFDQRAAELLAKEGGNAKYSQWMDELKKEREGKQKEIDDTYEEELDLRLKKLQQDINLKWTNGYQDEEELEKQLKEHLGLGDNVIDKTKKDKFKSEEDLRNKMDKEKKDLNDKLLRERQMFEEQIEGKNLVEEEKKLKLKNAILKQNNLLKDEEIVKDKLARTLEGVDIEHEKQQLLDQLRGQDDKLAELLSQDKTFADNWLRERMALRQKLLKQRRLLDNDYMLEKERINERIGQVAKEDAERAKIDKKYLEELFLNRTLKGEDAPEQDQAMLLNELASESFMNRLQNLLMRQFAEKDANLKLELQRFVDAKAIEKAALAAQFKAEAARLEELKDDMSEEDYNAAVRGLKLKEANGMREIGLQLERAHREEENRLCQELEKKHLQEQLALKQAELDEKLRLKKLLLNKNNAQGKLDDEIDKEMLAQYEEQQRREAERRLRNLEVMKQDIMREIDKEIGDKYNDFDDLLKRKREEERLLQDKTLSVRAKLKEREKMMKERIGMFNDATNEQMIKMYEKELNILTSAFERERRRQRLLMDEKRSKTQRLREKKEKMKQMVQGSQFENLRKKMQSGVQAAIHQESSIPDSELARALKKWKEDRARQNELLREKMYQDTVLDLNSDGMRKIIIRLQVLEQDLLELAKLKHYKLIQEMNSKQQKVSPSFDKKKAALKKKTLMMVPALAEESSTSTKKLPRENPFAQPIHEEDLKSYRGKKASPGRPAKLKEEMKPSNTPYLVKTDFESGKMTQDEYGNPVMGGMGKALPSKKKFVKK